MPKSNKNERRVVELKLSRQVPQRFPGDRKWKNEDVPSKDSNPKEDQDPIVKKARNTDKKP